MNDPATDRLVHLGEVEQALLGRLLTTAGATAEIPRLAKSWWTISRHYLIYRAIVAQRRAGKPHDAMAIVGVLKLRGELEDAGGVLYIMGLLDHAGVSDSLDYYADQIRECARRRLTGAIGKELVDLTLEPDEGRYQQRAQALMSRLKAVSAAEAQAALKSSTLIELMEAPAEPPPWVVRPWLAKGDIVVLAGEPGLGKSWLSLEIGVALAMGRPVADHIEVVGGPYRVMYLDEENNPRLVQYRLRKLVDGLDLGMHDVRQMQFKYYLQNSLNLDDAARLEALLAEVRKFKPDFIVLDSLVRFHGRDENSNSEMSSMASQILRPLAATGAGLVVIHHLAKPSKDRPAGELVRRVRGASDIVAAADQLWGLERLDDGLLLRHEKCRWADTSSPVSLRLEDVHVGNGVRLLANDHSESTQEQLMTKLYSAGTNGVLRSVLSNGDDTSRRTVSRLLGRMYEQGKVVKRHDGREMRYWLTGFAPSEELLV